MILWYNRNEIDPLKVGLMNALKKTQLRLNAFNMLDLKIDGSCMGEECDVMRGLLDINEFGAEHFEFDGVKFFDDNRDALELYFEREYNLDKLFEELDARGCFVSDVFEKSANFKQALVSAYIEEQAIEILKEVGEY